ncbi:COG1683: Uncharacterized conserved protein / FIG143828: Hypothetical protein YbgA [hydrothermal vent metagenome]|uniref:Uncharacterized protein n=1 Tax=hydrothermal vent metagenome TaxID=652676 RepID=A0A3B1BQI3_9ZZZZ
MGAQSSTRICIAVSACLLGERVRYDGAQKRHPLITKLADEFELQTFCPEVAIGLGVPRAPVQLVATSAGIRARGVADPEHDIGDRLQAYAQQQCEVLTTCAGLIFKSRSPSCGLGSSPLFNEQDEQTGETNGLFATVLQDCLPGVPMVEERALMTEDALTVFAGRVRDYDALSRERGLGRG